MTVKDPSDLTGKLLIAMPGMRDPRFDRSVVLLCAYSSDGAMGLILNKPAIDITFSDLLDQLSIDHSPGIDMPTVFVGGPVEHGRGFVLHSRDYGRAAATLDVDPNFGMTATIDILEDIARGAGPARSLLALGYAGWGPGQLEGELAENAWLVGDADPEVVFATAAENVWSAALGSLGVDPHTLSAEGGRA